MIKSSKHAQAPGPKQGATLAATGNALAQPRARANYWDASF